MDPARWKQIDDLVDDALELVEGERAAFVEKKTNGDADLREAVMALLGAHDAADDFLQNSAMKMMAKEIAMDQPFEAEFSLLNKTIGTYRIEKPIGAGGMGEVYLAFDEKMKRSIALKILPEDFVSNDERVKRFEIEAQAISSLNHPNIVTIYDVGNVDGVSYIATEFVEGKTLRELLGGKFRLRNVMANSIQICDALSSAHQAGIIHRDIKPENIMIRKDGYAKILDFGLAKLTDNAPGQPPNPANTTKGIIIGTPAYMSPAQICGETVDHRTDLWSCGVVLYEFLTGTNPFRGANRQETFEAVLSRAPDTASSLNPEIPAELDHILSKALEKDPDMGYQSASDFRADLKRVKRELDSSPSWSSGGLGTGSVRPVVKKKRKYWLATAAMLALIGAVVFIWAIFVREKPAVQGIDWSKAQSRQLTDHTGTEYFPSLSPDGATFVYASNANGNFDVFWQRVDGKNVTNLTADSPANDTQPAFSPNGDRIAFRSERDPPGIYVMGATGENLRRVCDFGFHPSWSPDGKELVVSTFGLDEPTVRIGRENALWIVNVDSGAKRELIKGHASLPTWSPSGKRIAYWYYPEALGRRDIATISIEGGEPTVITENFAVSNWNPVWSPDGKYLYFVSSKSGNPNFWRVRIDEISGRTLSEPEPIVTPSKYSRHLNFSRDGKRMIYVQTNNVSNIQGVEFDAKNGKALREPHWITQGDREISRAELSPDGTKFLMRIIRRTQDDLVTVSRNGRDWRDVTNDAPFDRYSRWSPDGKQIAFSSDRTGGGEVWICNADGTNLRQITFEYKPGFGTGFPVWSPDGKRLLFHTDRRSFIFDLSRGWGEQVLEELPRLENGHMVVWDWSPDGKKLAGVMVQGDKRSIGFYSLETRVYQVIVEGVNELPSWLPDSRRLVFSQGNKIFIVDTEAKKPKELLSITNDPHSAFVSRDGSLLYYVAHSTESDVWLLDGIQN